MSLKVCMICLWSFKFNSFRQKILIKVTLLQIKKENCLSIYLYICIFIYISKLTGLRTSWWESRRRTSPKRSPYLTFCLSTQLSIHLSIYLSAQVDRLEDELVGEQEKFKAITEELDQTFAEMSGYQKIPQSFVNTFL